MALEGIGSKMSLKNRAANIIDNAWHYSWHWDKHKVHWSIQAKSDCIKRLCEVQAELNQLKLILQELEPVVNEYLPTEEIFTKTVPKVFADSIFTLDEFDDQKIYLDGHGYYCYDGKYTTNGDVMDANDPIRKIATHVYWIDK